VTRRVLFYVQHLLGVGHLKRAEILAEAMRADGLDVTVALGGPPVPGVSFRGLRVVHLPPARIAGEDFSTLIDERGTPVDDAWKAMRRRALLDLFKETAPDVLLIELFPFGRRQFRFELIPLLETAHARDPRPRVACSVRDILVAAKRPGRDAEIVEAVRRWFDVVLVHGSPEVVPFDATFAAAGEIADLIRYTGYVAAPADIDAPEGGHGEVIVSAGGGAVGAPLLFAALAARPMTPLAHAVWRLIAGPNLPQADFDRLAAFADERTIVERFRADFAARLTVAALSVSQAGYNTTMDLLRARTPAVLVPYETAGETEQRLRSELLARKGLVTIVPAAELSAERLARGFAEALARPPRRSESIDLSGAETSARLLRDLAERGALAAHAKA
jgi:predicted glycosyltransferase